MTVYASDQFFVTKFGARARELRLEKRFSLTDVARNSGLLPSTVGAIEHGRYAANLRTFAALARGLGVRMTDLINIDQRDDLSSLYEVTRTNPYAVELIQHRVKGQRPDTRQPRYTPVRAQVRQGQCLPLPARKSRHQSTPLPRS